MTLFSLTGLVGQLVSGVVIIYSLLMVMLLTPGVMVHVLPREKSISLDKSVEKNEEQSLSKCLFDLIQQKEPETISRDLEVSLNPLEKSSFVTSTAENVFNMISSHFASSSSSSSLSSTPASIPSSPSHLQRESSVSDEEGDPFVMVTESDIERDLK